MAEIDDLKMILRNADISCITDAKTFQEQKVRFGECIIFVSSLERREAEIRAKDIDEFAEDAKKQIVDFDTFKIVAVSRDESLVFLEISLIFLINSSSPLSTKSLNKFASSSSPTWLMNFFQISCLV